MRKPRKKVNNWAQRRVCFVISDAYHKLTMANITMPVRVRGRTDDGLTIYEGPIETMWETRVAPRYNTGKIAKELSIYSHDLVGVLVASTESMNEGSITWVEQSEATNPIEAGADKIKGEGSMIAFVISQAQAGRKTLYGPFPDVTLAMQYVLDTLEPKQDGSTNTVHIPVEIKGRAV